MISDKIKTITLRFRDLSKDTIALHKAIIDKKVLFGGDGGQKQKKPLQIMLL